MTISRRAFLRGFSATAGIAALAGCDLLGQLDPTDGEGIGIIAPARTTDQPDPNSTPTVAPDTWRMGAPMPTPRVGVAGAAAHGRIHVMGGWLPEAASNANEAYDPSTDRWQEAAPLPQPLAATPRPSAPTARYTSSEVSSKFFAHPPVPGATILPTDRWDQLRPMPTPRGGLSAAFVAGKIYAVGGIPAGIQEDLSTLEAYDISNDQMGITRRRCQLRECVRGRRSGTRNKICDSWW